MKLINKGFMTGGWMALLSGASFAGDKGSRAFPGLGDGAVNQTTSDVIGFIYGSVEKMGFATLATLLLLTVVTGVLVFKSGMDEYKETKKIGSAVMMWFVGGVSILACLGLILYGVSFLQGFKL